MKTKKPRVRDYKAEYKRRIDMGKVRGYSRAQASGHPNLKIGESGISQKNKTAFPQDTIQDNQRTALMVATSPCVACICTGTPEECKKLDKWLKNG